MAEIIKKTKIKSPAYRRFLDGGLMQFVTEEDINAALGNIQGQKAAQGRALLIALYYTGARPNEILRVKGKDITREQNYIIVRTPGSKNGLTRPVHLPFNKPLVKELYKYAVGAMPEAFLFYDYQTKHIRQRVLKNGSIKEYIEITDGLRYYFKKWFNFLDIPPYYLRHNRFSSLAEAGVTMETLRQLKGSKTFTSIQPYLHLSASEAKKAARKMK